MADKRITDVDFVDSLNSNESFFINQNNAIKQINKTDIVFGIVNGGTGATNAAKARENLGAAASSHSHTASDIVNGTLNIELIPTVVVEKGGTGGTNAAEARENLGITPENIGAATSGDLSQLQSEVLNIKNNSLPDIYKTLLTKVGFHLLWENPEPNSAYGASEYVPITHDLWGNTLDLSDCSFIMVLYALDIDGTRQYVSSFVPVGFGSGLNHEDVTGATVCFGFIDGKQVRRYCYATDTGIVFGQGGYKTSISDDTYDISNKFLVPIYIYGVGDYTKSETDNNDPNEDGN